ncbi:MAG TPA: valine--tRNA ligase [Patescibacteria group bacterium]|nr:valine--tRNA ligase [Patescibacteria group bacterium]
MDKVYDHKKIEEKTYRMWENGKYFQPEIHPTGKPYCIVLPPPNANGALHFGHAMFTVEDILIRYHRMMGEAALWLPGTDHAGIETQFVFEKQLAKSGKSRFDYSRVELYDLIKAYVDENRGGIEIQLRRLGYSLDWTREKYTLDPRIVTLVKQTFRKMYDESIIYRDYRLVNYCTKDGTSFSDLEVSYEERQDPLYYIKYGPLILATTRPETKFGDTAVAVNPNDKRYKKYIGKEIEIETVSGKVKMKVIADEYVDPQFGTGVVKITPAHDFNDYEVGKRHQLPMKQVIGFDGKMNECAGEFAGMSVKKAREAVVAQMQKKGLIEKIDTNYMHRVGICYKCKTVLEPLPLEQWYVNVQTLKQKAIAVVREGRIQIFPKNFEQPYFQWLENLRDWNISRQNVWGIQIPVWYEVNDAQRFTVSFIDQQSNHRQGNLQELLDKGFGWEEIVKGLQRVIAPISATAVFEEQKEKEKKYLPETDTFDTWFSSGQWPFVTLKTSKQGDFEKFYPTAVLETAYDILKAWVSRMVMLGIYITPAAVPFHHVLVHGIVNDPYGKKMSKSKGNVVNPLELADQYGADAVRFALIYGNATGSDQILSYPKLEAARKFTNKLWNMARFIEFKMQQDTTLQIAVKEIKDLSATDLNDKHILDKTKKFSQEITRYIEKYQFNLAAERLYEFSWHEFADIYIEDVKKRVTQESFTVLVSLYLTIITLLHPFMPFVTEEIYQRLYMGEKPLIIQPWPRT